MILINLETYMCMSNKVAIPVNKQNSDVQISCLLFVCFLHEAYRYIKISGIKKALTSPKAATTVKYSKQLPNTTAVIFYCYVAVKLINLKDNRVTEGFLHILIGGDTRQSPGPAPGALTANIKRTRSLPGRMERHCRPFT